MYTVPSFLPETKAKDLCISQTVLKGILCVTVLVLDGKSVKILHRNVHSLRAVHYILSGSLRLYFICVLDQIAKEGHDYAGQ